MGGEVEKFKKDVSKPKAVETVPWKMGLSTGSTLLNLAITGRLNVGFLPGYYYFFVGDSDSGKSFITLSSMAEASINPLYDNYRFIYDGGEYGALMDLKKFYGTKMASRLEPPSVVSGGAVYSTTVEEFYYYLDDWLDKDQPVIYILDSMDVLSSQEEQKKFAEGKRAFRKQKEGETEKVAGSFGDGKAKKNSSHLRRVIPKLKRTKSILIIINQTRDNVGSFSFEKKTRSGGHALEFYACAQMWSSKKEKIKKNVRGKDRTIGNRCKLIVKRSRFTGRNAVVEIPLLTASGIDDVGGCISYLLEEKHFSKSGSTITAAEFEFKGTFESLVSHIEEKNLESKLRALVAEVWQDVVESSQLKRKRRYE